jgi:hypothetical protein
MSNGMIIVSMASRLLKSAYICSTWNLIPQAPTASCRASDGGGSRFADPPYVLADPPSALPRLLRAATNGGWALGDKRFKQRIAKALGPRVAPLARGRPPKADAERRQLNLL